MKLLSTLSLAAILASTASMAFATPILRDSVVVSSSIVTVGDMFDNAGSIAEEALFRAPGPGSTGVVSLIDVRAAAARIGLLDYLANGVAEVRVERLGTQVDEDMLTRLIAEDLQQRGILTPGMTASTMFDKPFETITAEAVAQPAHLDQLRYLPTGRFSARFTVVGSNRVIDIDGQIDLMIETAHLSRNLPAGTILGASDIQMRQIPLQYAEAGGALTVDALVGKQLQRQSREGMMLKASDVAAPTLVSRNEMVTVVFRQGAMTLSVKGQALNAATEGQTVSVLNTATKKIIRGVATASGTVLIDPSAQMNVAGL